MTLIHIRRWWAAAAAGAAGTMLAAACGAGGGSSALATITPASPHQLAGDAGTSGPPSPLATAMPTMSGMPSTAPATASAAQPVAGNAVTIRNFAFGPSAVTVKPGTTVHWANRDSEAHTVTSDTGAFSSPVLQPNAGYSFTFTKPGTYAYHCTIHPFMTGTVVVS
jgi:plastocyanin